MQKCLICGERHVDDSALYKHYDDTHQDSIPKDFVPAQYHYMLRTGKDAGQCVVCKQATPWNDKTSKYHRFCTNPNCKERYRQEFKKRMIGKYGQVHLLNDPDKQREMLAGRAISGEYKWSSGKKVPYTGSYEKDFLRFLDVFMDFPVEDVMSPSPHTYYYVHEGVEKFYIPDVYIPSLNLEIEIKDGGDNPNNHHKIQAVDKRKEELKDNVMKNQKDRSYIKLVNRKYELFFALLAERKRRFIADEDVDAPIVLLEHAEVPVVEGQGAVPEQRFFHVSSVNKQMLHLTPRVPHNFLTSRGYEDSTTRRVSLSSSIDGCLMGLSQNLQGQELYVYEPVDYKRLHVVTPDATQVPDATLTGEVWSLKPVTMRQTVRIKVEGAKPQPYSYDYGENLKAELYKWYWETQSDSLVTEASNVLEDRIPVYVLLSHSGTLLANAIKKVTKNPYSHASISFDHELNNMYSFGRKYKSNPLIGSFVRESIREGLYEDVSGTATYSLYVTFIPRAKYTQMIQRLDMFRNDKRGFKYDFTGLFKHRLGMVSEREDAYFCSGFVATILQAGNENFFKQHYSLVTPYDFAKHKDFHFVTKGVLQHYDATKVKQKVQQLHHKLYT